MDSHRESESSDSNGTANTSPFQHIQPTGSDPDLTVRETTPRRPAQVGYKEPIGNFLINREIGRGGMGVVYEATEAILNRRVALKILPPAALMDEIQVRRFRNEAAAAAQLVHPNIVPVYSVGSDRGVHFYAMQLIDGQNIAQVIGSIRERISSQQRLDRHVDTRKAGGTTHATKNVFHATQGLNDVIPSRRLIEEEFAAAASSRRYLPNSQRLFKSIAALGRDAARAISYAHENGIIHRDIKPSNLLLDDKGKIWVTDFGLAQVRDNPIGTGTGDIVGTLKYMSPEQASGRKFLVDHRTDVYSLGVTLYELLTLKPALRGTDAREIIRQVSFEDPLSVREINPRIPLELDTIIAKAIAKKPHDRYTTAAEMADDLERFCNDQPIAAKRPSLLQKCRRWTAKHQTLTGMLGVALGMMFIAAIGLAAAMVRLNASEVRQRKQAEAELSRSEGLRLLLNATNHLASNPGLALALAVEGARRIDGLEANTTVQAALDANHEQKVLYPRPEPTARIAIDSRGQLMVSTVANSMFGKGSYPAVVSNLKTSAELSRLDSGEAITSAAFSPNAEWILTASCSSRPYDNALPQATEFGSVCLWEAATGRRLTSYTQHMLNEAQPEMFAPDNSAVVLPGPNNDSSVYSTQSQRVKFVLSGHSQPVIRAIFSPNGLRIATVDASGEIRIWDALDGTWLKTISTADRSIVHQLAFSFDSRAIALAAHGGTRTIRIDNDLDIAPEYWREPSFAVSPQQNRCATFWNSSPGVAIRDLLTGDVIFEVETADAVGVVTFSSNGQQVAIASGSQVAIYDAGTGILMFELKGHTDSVSDVAFTNAAGTIVTASRDRSVRIWSSESGAERQNYVAALDGMGTAAVQFSNDSQQVLSASSLAMQTLLFDIDGNRLYGQIPGELLSAEFRAGRLVVVDGSSVSIFDPKSSRLIATHDFEGQSIQETASLPGDESILLVMNESVSLLWKPSGDEVIPLTAQGDRITAYDISEDGMFFTLGTANGKCQVHEVASGKRLRTIPHPLLVSSVRFFPTGDKLVTIDASSTLRLWGASNEIPEKSLRQDDLAFNDCFISPDGKLVVSYHQWLATPVCCWDIEAGTLLRQTPGAALLKVSQSCDGSKVLLASKKDGLKRWDFVDGELAVISSRPTVDAEYVGERIVSIEFPEGTDFSGSNLVGQLTHYPSVLRYYLAGSGEPIAELPATDGDFQRRLSINPLGNQVAISTAVHSVAIHDRLIPHSADRIGRHLAPITFASFLGNSKMIVTASMDGIAKIWSEGLQSLFELDAKRGAITAAAVTRDGLTLACGHKDGSIVLWETNSGKQLVALSGGTEGIQSLAFDSVGQHLLSTEQAGIARYWSLLSRDFSELNRGTTALSARLSPDNRYALVMEASQSQSADASNQATTIANVYDLGGNHSILPVPNSAGVTAIAFANTTNQFALTLSDGIAHTFNLMPNGTVTQVSQFGHSTSPLGILAYSPDDSLLATLTYSALTVWDVPSGEERLRLYVPDDELTITPQSHNQRWTPFSQDGNWLAYTTLTRLRIRPVLPADVAEKTIARALLPKELEQFKIGQAKPEHVPVN